MKNSTQTEHQLFNMYLTYLKRRKSYSSVVSWSTLITAVSILTVVAYGTEVMCMYINDKFCHKLHTSLLIKRRDIYLRLHSLCILQGGQRILGGVLKFLEQKQGGYENCLNISWGGCLFFVRFCLAFVIVLKSEKRNDKQGL